MARGRLTDEQVALFLQKVERRGPAECWPWTAAVNQWGYGRVWVSARTAIPAAQAAWEVEHGERFPEDREASHTCDNPPCCNPAHIVPETHAENMARMAGRCRQGHKIEGANALWVGHWVCRSCTNATRRARRARQTVPAGT